MIPGRGTKMPHATRVAWKGKKGKKGRERGREGERERGREGEKEREKERKKGRKEERNVSQTGPVDTSSKSIRSL